MNGSECNEFFKALASGSLNLQTIVAAINYWSAELFVELAIFTCGTIWEREALLP